MHSWIQPRTRNNHSSTSGMTLLEILVVVIIVGVLAAISTPGWVTFVNRQRASRAQNQILKAIRDTQAQARRTRRARTLTLTADVNGLPQLESDRIPATSLGEGDLEPGMLSLQVIDFDSAASVLDANGSVKIQFDPHGAVNLEENDNLTTLPTIISVSAPAGANMQRCVIIETLLGAVRSGRDAECDPTTT